MEEKTTSILEEALYEKYERIKNKINNYEEESSERRIAESEMTDLIKELQTLNKVMTEANTKAEERRVEEEQNEKMFELELNKLNEHHKVEQERNEANMKLEKERQKVNWQRAALEIGKVVTPAIISGIIYFRAQRNVLEFEETGRITSTAGRGLGLPKIFK